ncbi:uncharacterized protein LOC108666677 isoform X2 [Hyalella azteca]|uniref:Uncharacterized protein LOC108666677 isoform X2 n=1 Tax=Hyalella azteca TaxID=294128 RepID=A0A8B7N650_HYAAZ|nr:uncharacterized protein LOC108666677 isoform X2 [Hyalella azteca]
MASAVKAIWRDVKGFLSSNSCLSGSCLVPLKKRKHVLANSYDDAPSQTCPTMTPSPNSPALLPSCNSPPLTPPTSEKTHPYSIPRTSVPSVLSEGSIQHCSTRLDYGPDSGRGELRTPLQGSRNIPEYIPNLEDLPKDCTTKYSSHRILHHVQPIQDSAVNLTNYPLSPNPCGYGGNSLLDRHDTEFYRYQDAYNSVSIEIGRRCQEDRNPSCFINDASSSSYITLERHNVTGFTSSEYQLPIQDAARDELGRKIMPHISSFDHNSGQSKIKSGFSSVPARSPMLGPCYIELDLTNDGHGEQVHQQDYSHQRPSSGPLSPPSLSTHSSHNEYVDDQRRHHATYSAADTRTPEYTESSATSYQAPQRIHHMSADDGRISKTPVATTQASLNYSDSLKNSMSSKMLSQKPGESNGTKKPKKNKFCYFIAGKPLEDITSGPIPQGTPASDAETNFKVHSTNVAELSEVFNELDSCDRHYCHARMAVTKDTSISPENSRDDVSPNVASPGEKSLNAAQYMPHIKDSTFSATARKKKPRCSLCLNHNKSVDLRGHKDVCEFRNCTCDYCIITKKRREAYKIQQNLNRRQDRERQNFER